MQAYFFEDNDSDDQSTSDLSPLIRRPSAQPTPTPYTHIITGYLSIVELVVLVSTAQHVVTVLTPFFLHQVAYMGSLLGLTIWRKDYDGDNVTMKGYETNVTTPNPDRMVAYFSMIHVGIWIIVGIFDRYR